MKNMFKACRTQQKLCYAIINDIPVTFHGFWGFQSVKLYSIFEPSRGNSKSDARRVIKRKRKTLFLRQHRRKRTGRRCLTMT